MYLSLGGAGRPAWQHGRPASLQWRRRSNDHSWQVGGSRARRLTQHWLLTVYLWQFTSTSLLVDRLLFCVDWLFTRLLCFSVGWHHWLTAVMSLPACLHRYLDNVVNKQTVSPPIPHLHALLTSGDKPPPQIDVFELIKSSYEVRLALLSPFKKMLW